MTELVPGDDVPQDEDALLAYLIDVVERSRHVAAVQVNATLTMTYWHVGRAIRREHPPRRPSRVRSADCCDTVAPIEARFRSGFDRTNVTRMVTFARAFPEQG